MEVDYDKLKPIKYDLPYRVEPIVKVIEKTEGWRGRPKIPQIKVEIIDKLNEEKTKSK